MPITGERPPDPDHVAPRGTDAYTDAVKELHKWVAKNHARGVPLDQLVDRYDDFGNTSHDWKEWNDWGGGFNKPAEWGEEMSNIGMFRQQAARGDYTEWPPGSGIYFNDPANDASSRKWFNDFGDQVGSPQGLQDMPEIDYNAVNEGFGGNVRKYLDAESQHQKNAKNAPGIDPNDDAYKKGVGSPVADNVAQPIQAQGFAPTHGAWGVSGVGGGGGIGAKPMAQKPMQQNRNLATPGNPFMRQRSGGGKAQPFSQTGGYQQWHM